MIKHTIYAIGLGLLVFALYLFQYTGAFKSVKISVDKREPMQVIYKDYMGPYHKIVSTIEEVENYGKKNGLKCRLTFGEYMDNPDYVEEGRLKARAGCVIDPLVIAESRLLENLQAYLPVGYKVGTIPGMKAAVAIFAGAPGIGPLKVYPKAKEFIRKNSLVALGTVYEIYEVFGPKSVQTTYLWPLE